MVVRRQKGFTLVELMITMLILSITAFIAVPKFADMLEKSKEGATRGNLAAIRGGLANYFSDNQGIYPKTLDTATSTFGTGSSARGFHNFVPFYIDDPLPGVKATGKHSGNAVAHRSKGPGIGNSAAAVTLGTFTSPAFVATSDGKGWKYNPATGDIWINSTMLGMGGFSYTAFGFE
jgi:prepilin-type N-terminal cleavage/methylation domain-containing protein